MTSWWARWRLKTPASRLFTQPFIQAQIKENIKAPHHCLSESESLAFVLGIHRWPVNSPHKWPVKRKMFPFDDVIMETNFISSPRLQAIYLSSFSDETTLQRPDVGVTNAPLVYFSIRDITFWSCENTCWIIRVTFVSYRCHSSRAAATPVKYERDIQSEASVLMSLKNWQNKRTLGIGLVTPPLVMQKYLSRNIIVMNGIMTRIGLYLDLYMHRLAFVCAARCLTKFRSITDPLAVIARTKATNGTERHRSAVNIWGFKNLEWPITPMYGERGFMYSDHLTTCTLLVFSLNHVRPETWGSFY